MKKQEQTGQALENRELAGPELEQVHGGAHAQIGLLVPAVQEALSAAQKVHPGGVNVLDAEVKPLK